MSCARAKIIFILLDGLTWFAASRLCYLQALENAGEARRLPVSCQLPPISRPIYATLLTGLPPIEHGILTNSDQRALEQQTFFSLAAAKGLRTAAAAYAWFYELCNPGCFNPALHRMLNNDASQIQHGIFYSSDAYPDAELFADAEALRESHNPDLLLVHSMGIDFAGHCHGGASPQYLDACSHVDAILASYLPIWQKAGYKILIASDHGMAKAGGHYCAEPEVIKTPLWLIGKNWPKSGKIEQTEICSLLTGAFA